MSRLAAAIDVATEYAVHLNQTDGVPADRAISLGAAAVVRAVRANPSKYAGHRTPKQDAGLSSVVPVLSTVGSTLSALGLIKTIFG